VFSDHDGGVALRVVAARRVEQVRVSGKIHELVGLALVADILGVVLYYLVRRLLDGFRE
jgi:hypothetical protein